ncbi:sugar transferase [Pedobacter frigoris]|uniref:Sugar transferase n=1 Tax=Pedobacter frigoris TaxID=2571272 RepID=A0A4U1CHB1_9SPHI|nr:sugar transferase [Pedobacter frigoris]TKC05282.1 sugar transferase [Pedobacter frigoris]
MYKIFVKRLIDFFFALVGFIILLPVFFLVLLLLTIVNQGKPFFFQIRPGKNNHMFKIIKFKTMNDKRGKNGELMPDVVRLTKIGAFVRRTSLDEIPQLFNVIKGEMSLIGPRPLLPEYLQLYSKEQIRRHEVKPGITGWAQINGRNAISWDQKFKLDIYYVENLSFWLDLKIILLTIKKVLIKEGISSGSSVTMEKFTRN